MDGVASRAESPPVTTSAGDASDRGSAIRERVEALGITDREWHAITGIDRKTLGRAIRNEPGTRASTYTAIEAELDKLERRAAGEPVAMGQPDTEKPNVLRVEVKGVYGAEALIVEAPPENLAELEEMVDRIMRNLRGGGSLEDL